MSQEMFEQQRGYLRSIVRGAYDTQKLRIALGNRIIIAWKSKMDIQGGTKKKDGETTTEKEKEDSVLVQIKLDYKLIADGLAERKRTVNEKLAFKKIGVISTYTEYCLIDQYLDLHKKEKAHFKRLEMILEDFPLWNNYLKDIRGMGPAMAGVILSEFNILEAQYVSSLWKYAGLDVAPNDDGVMEGRSRKKHHLIPKTYTNAAGEVTDTVGITYNPWLKTKLMGVLADSFIRSGSPRYRKIYDDYKNRIANMPEHEEKSLGHRNNMAKRYMIKQFLADLYVNWKNEEGLVPELPYAEEKLGIKHRRDVA